MLAATSVAKGARERPVRRVGVCVNLGHPLRPFLTGNALVLLGNGPDGGIQPALTVEAAEAPDAIVLRCRCQRVKTLLVVSRG
jgi:hypothetical protein